MRRSAYTTTMHVLTVRIDRSLYLRLAAKARAEQASLNALVTDFIAEGLLDSPLATRTKPEDALPWLSD